MTFGEMRQYNSAIETANRKFDDKRHSATEGSEAKMVDLLGLEQQLIK